MQKITPFLWFNDNAEDAAAFYVSVFKNAKLGSTARYDEAGAKTSGRPKGSTMTVEFAIEGYHFTALNGGPIFTVNPSISFFVNFDPSKDEHAREHLDALWEKLSEGGKALMPIDTYPFSKRYGWIQDKYGVSWQLILTNPGGEERPLIIPSLLFVRGVCGKAEEASDFYMSVFKKAKRGMTARYPAGMEPDKEGTVMFTDFTLEDQWFAAMDSAHKHDFAFNEAVSFVVHCETQAEIDHDWGRLTANGGQEVQCGWLKDAYGVSWQIVPAALSAMMQDKDPAKSERVMEAMLRMKKLDIEVLQKAFEGSSV